MNRCRSARNDLILVAAIVLIAAAGFLLYRANREPGAFAAVKINGTVTEMYPLSENAEIPITTGEKGEQENLLVIEDGKARISAANCPDEICVKTRPVSYVGETIVCLPHKVVIEIVAESADFQLDTVV